MKWHPSPKCKNYNVQEGNSITKKALLTGSLQKKDVALKCCIFDPLYKWQECVWNVVDSFNFCKYKDLSATVFMICNISYGPCWKVPMNNNIFTSKVSKMIIWQIQYFGVQAPRRARQPKDVYHFKITQLKLNEL